MRSWMEQAKEVLAQSDYPDAPYEIKNIDKTLAALPDDAGYVRIFNEKTWKVGRPWWVIPSPAAK